MFCTLVQVAQRSPASDKVADYLRANNERTDDIGGRRGYLLTSGRGLSSAGALNAASD